MGDQAERAKPSTVSFRYRALQQFAKWLVEEGEVEANPMAGMKPPAVPVAPVPVLSVEELRALLKTCEGRDFVERRDTAIIRMFIDTGMKLSEFAGLRTGDIDMNVDVATVIGKGRRPRSCPFGHKTGQAIDRYLRVRAHHPRQDEAEPWLGYRGKGPLTSSGIAQIIRRRG